MSKKTTSIAAASALAGAGVLLACSSSSSPNLYDGGSLAGSGGVGGSAGSAGAGNGGAGPFLVRGASSGWHVVSTVTVQNTNAALTRLTVLVPAPQTNAYQDISNLQYNGATQLGIPETDDDYYLQFTNTSGLPAPGASATSTIEYDVTLYQISVNLGQVTSILPYDTTAPDYSWYTGARGDYVDPNNPTIVSIANTLAADAGDGVVAFARAAYEYVGSHYQYLNPNTGLHTLPDILAAGGGDCGNLTSIYVSLLRNRGIPARHLVTMRPDGSDHVWADFLLQGYGWVPADVTYKQADPSGDYFGIVALGTNGIIMDKQIYLTLDDGNGTVQAPLLQGFAWWYWSTTASPSITASYSLVSTPK